MDILMLRMHRHKFAMKPAHTVAAQHHHADVKRVARKFVHAYDYIDIMLNGQRCQFAKFHVVGGR
jgi:hypothetical protein